MVKAMEVEVEDPLMLTFVPSAVGGYMLFDSSTVLVSSVDWGGNHPSISKRHVLDIGLRLEGKDVMDTFKVAVDEDEG